MMHAMFRVPSLFRAPSEFRPEWGLQTPDTQVALTVSGKICWPNQGRVMCLDAPLLRQFDQHELLTTTDWPRLVGPQRFKGVALTDVLLASGWRGNWLTLSGADGYSAEAPLADLKCQGGLIATELNGMPLPSTRFAPLWLVFPFDDAKTGWDRNLMRRRSVWKLTDIEVS